MPRPGPDSRIPRIVAHRGDARGFPENTFKAFSAAIEAGVSHVELDVQLSRDGQPMIIHDPSLQRTCGLADRVWERDADVLARIDAGFGFSPAQRGFQTQIPALSALPQFAEHCPHVTWFVEIKQQSIERFGLEETTDAVISALGRSRACIISFNAKVPAHVREHSDMQTGWVITDYDQDGQALAESLRPDFLFCNHEKLGNPVQLWPGAWQWVFYEVTAPSLARSLGQAGAEFVETMAVRPMVQALRNASG